MTDYTFRRWDPPDAVDDRGILLQPWWGFEWAGIVAGDDVSPTVDNFEPASGSSIARYQAIAFDVTDEAALARVFVSAYFPESGAWEVVHDGAVFAPSYASSTRTAIAGGYHYTLTRTGGWPGQVRLRVNAVDAGGNLD